MENYMDGAFAVTNHTIITYCATHAALNIPGRFADIDIRRIGSGSFMESGYLQQVVIPPQVREIGDQAFDQCPELTSVFISGGVNGVGTDAFAHCPQLREITIYDLPLSAGEYQSYKNIANKCSDGTYVLRRMPNNELVRQVVAAVTVEPACRIPDEVPLLFWLEEFDEKYVVSLGRKNPVIGFAAPCVPLDEDRAFCAYTMKQKAELYFGKAEQKNDWYVRMGKRPEIGKTIIFTFDDAKTREEKGKYLISATLKIGYFFWQSAQPVVCEGAQYYIYRRYFLSGDPEIEFVRRDIAAYTDDGSVADREKAMMVYGKYKLLSIL